MIDLNELAKEIQKLHGIIRDSVIDRCENAALEELSEIKQDTTGDTIYGIDRISENELLEFFETNIAGKCPVVLIAEGLENGKIVLPCGSNEEDAAWRILVDPIDGTRGLMYQKRSAWILTGIAPNYGNNTRLQDIQFAIQTEIPLLKQHLSDQLWSFKGRGVTAVRHNRLTGENNTIQLQPSRAKTIAHGFAMTSRFFPGARDVLAAIDEEIVLAALGPVQPGKAHCFEDQYICTGGQFYELMAGHDRFNADLRPLMEQVLLDKGLRSGICCHPYDVCSELIASEMGVIICDENGQPLNPRLDVDSDVCWIGYANKDIRAQIEQLLMDALRKRGVL